MSPTTSKMQGWQI